MYEARSITRIFMYHDVTSLSKQLLNAKYSMHRADHSKYIVSFYKSLNKLSNVSGTTLKLEAAIMACLFNVYWLIIGSVRSIPGTYITD